MQHKPDTALIWRDKRATLAGIPLLVCIKAASENYIIQLYTPSWCHHQVHPHRQIGEINISEGRKGFKYCTDVSGNSTDTLWDSVIAIGPIRECGMAHTVWLVGWRVDRAA